MIPELWTFPLRFTTPAFIGGAEPNVRAELRVPSIRGALRAWYRVIVGPEVAAGLVPTHAHLRESLLFGGTGRGEGQGLASLSLEDRAPTGEHSWSNKEIRGRNPGLAYLGFSFDFRPNNRRYIASDTTFRLRVLLARGAPDDAADLLLHTLWAWVTLGGLGSRSRRGFGSLAWDGAPELGRLGGARVQRSL
ncbi:MAG TPA: type III-B CRISPR module RAMP protein Cmr1, partial [Myxococcota bacterium]|nr:type III-B CRISPR module RAMP protein Cmr1 [Myxococcota bacterium]